MSRGRPTNMSRSNTMSEQEQLVTTVWHDLVDTLRLLPPTAPGVRIAQADETKPLNLGAMTAEKKHLDDALEKLQMLIALRRNEPDALPIPSVQVSAPGSAAGGAGMNKRKRRTSLSMTASPAPPSLPPNSADSVLTPVASPLPRGGTPAGSREGLSKAKKELYADQLPLQPGRKVAFKVPAQKGAGDDGGHGDDWILTTIKRCINMDKMRYEVQDVDDAETSFNTTLRSIIPLPDPSAAPHISSHPSHLEDYPRGSQVLGLYPDTTSFYSATVVAAPLPPIGASLSARANVKPDPGAKKDKYRLAFVDDGDKIHEVDRFYVVAFPE